MGIPFDSQFSQTALAPLFAAYGRWVVDSITDAGSEAVFGVMREGRFLNRVVTTVAKRCGKTIAAKEVWLSRRAVVRAALWQDDFSLLAQAITHCPGPTTDDILEQMGLTRADLAESFKDSAAVELHAAGGVEALLTAVSRSSDLQSKIAEESKRRRQSLLTYLSNASILEHKDRLFLLDLGYAETIQTALQKIVVHEGIDAQLTGLYVAINTRGQENVRTGSDLRALFGSDGYESPLTRVLERTPDVLEHSCMCVEGSLDAFGEGGEPIFLESQRDDAQIIQLEAMQDGIIAGINAIMDLFENRSAANPAFITHAGEIVRQAMLRPTVEESETIGRWYHEANFDLADRRALSDLRMDVSSLEFGNAAAWLNIARHEAYWPAAALARIAPHMVEVTAAL